MGKFEMAERVGLRDRDTDKLIAVYPNRVEGTDAEIDRDVRTWFYRQSCSAEETLRNAYVDVLTDNELKAHKI